MEKLEKLISAMHEAEDEVREALRNGEDLTRFVSISAGNTKMGKVASVSLLPVLTCPGRCNGTCGDKCYAKKLAILRPTVARAYARNTAVAKLAPLEFFGVVSKAMQSVPFFRFHVSQIQSTSTSSSCAVAPLRSAKYSCSRSGSRW